MPTARIVRGLVLSLKEKEFVEAAGRSAPPDWRIISRHLIPNCIGPIIVAMTFTVAAAIITESTLSFFGFGVTAHADLGQPAGRLQGATSARASGGWWCSPAWRS